MALLSELLPSLEMTPLANNIASAALTVIYVVVVMEMSNVVRDRFGMPEVARKIIHVAAASWLVFWPLFDTSHWSWTFNIAVPASYFVKLIYLALILRDRNHEDIKNMSRTGDPLELLVGPLQFVVVMCWLGLAQFMTEEATIIMAALGIGDGIAPLVGTKWGKHKYPVLGSSTKKSLEGSIGGVFFGTVIGCCLYPPKLGFDILPWRQVFAIATIATIGEGTAPLNSDNLVVPALIHLSLDRVKEAM